MSDYEDEFMCDEDEDYDLEYSEDSNSEPDVDLENQYYNSKALKEEDPKAALESFQRVLDLVNDWRTATFVHQVRHHRLRRHADKILPEHKHTGAAPFA